MPIAERMLQVHERRLDDLEDKLLELLQRHYALAAASGGGTSSGGKSVVRVARATTVIAASDATTPGAGTVQPLKIDGDGNYVDDGDPLTANNVGGEVSSGKRGLLMIDEAGAPWFTPEECESS